MCKKNKTLTLTDDRITKKEGHVRKAYTWKTTTKFHTTKSDEQLIFRNGSWVPYRDIAKAKRRIFQPSEQIPRGLINK